ncbi:putative oxalocrotonate tautomerase [Podospora aff. communis PSN243]|uniref:Oxalocrotonate tautomerase n=1 Tax=Podospora aff. communis PSN243 TaxID=3040156 RepID=A0AAV9GHC8_9PEZI|nr:putative oxalocrotonate tautomerase [Podospora aff. communis PSN243]
MPLWLVYHPEGTFVTPESKQALAADVMTMYTGGGLPAFYVVVNFITLPHTSIFVGGKNPPVEKPFIRFTVDHLAVHFGDDAERKLRVINTLDRLIKPHVADKGYDWEFSVDETPRELWKINGFIPPPHKSEAEAKWARDNRPSEWQGKL